VIDHFIRLLHGRLLSALLAYYPKINYIGKIWDFQARKNPESHLTFGIEILYEAATRLHSLFLLL
ncbi:MAG: hypothetical protein II477_06085, partial [Lachnospiraceae bacterium]|nr:hypothetical protein [Lachnospiraceae bacterium]